MNKKSGILTIGQFAAMHGINKKTLMKSAYLSLLPSIPKTATDATPITKALFWKPFCCCGNWMCPFPKYRTL